VSRPYAESFWFWSRRQGERRRQLASAGRVESVGRTNVCLRTMSRRTCLSDTLGAGASQRPRQRSVPRRYPALDLAIARLRAAVEQASTASTSVAGDGQAIRVPAQAELLGRCGLANLQLTRS